MTQADVTLSLANNRLTISGSSVKPEAYAAEGVESKFSERRFGDFERVVRVPAGLDASEVKASMEHGVLKIELPREVAKPAATKIAIA